MHYTCIGSQLLILLWEWIKNHPQVYLGDCRYRVKKNTDVQIHKCQKNQIQGQIQKQESKSDTELIAKLKSNSDSE